MGDRLSMRAERPGVTGARRGAAAAAGVAAAARPGVLGAEAMGDDGSA
jgi:hypothetical protein